MTDKKKHQTKAPGKVFLWSALITIITGIVTPFSAHIADLYGFFFGFALFVVFMIGAIRNMREYGHPMKTKILIAVVIANSYLLSIIGLMFLATLWLMSCSPRCFF